MLVNYGHGYGHTAEFVGVLSTIYRYYGWDCSLLWAICDGVDMIFSKYTPSLLQNSRLEFGVRVTEQAAAVKPPNIEQPRNTND